MVQQQIVTSVENTCGYEGFCWNLLVTINDNIFVLLSTFFLFLVITVLPFYILCETVNLSDRPQALGESPTIFSLPSVNILLITYNQVHIWEITLFLKRYDFTNPSRGSQRKIIHYGPLLYVQIQIKWPSNQSYGDFSLLEQHFHTEEKCGSVFVVLRAAAYHQHIKARQTLKEGKEE